MSIETWVASTVGKLAIVAAVAVAGAIGGCVARSKYDAGLLSEVRVQRDQWKATAENRRIAIDEINAQAAADAQEAKRRLSEAEDAAVALGEAWRAAESRADALDDELDKAKRKKPACAALLAMNLFATCGVKPR